MTPWHRTRPEPRDTPPDWATVGRLAVRSFLVLLLVFAVAMAITVKAGGATTAPSAAAAPTSTPLTIVVIATPALATAFIIGMRRTRRAYRGHHRAGRP